MKKRKETKEVLEVVENAEKEIIEKDASGESLEEISESVVQNVSEAISEEELKEISEAIAEETSAEDVSDDISQEIADAFAEEVSEEVSEEDSEEMAKEVSEEGLEETTEEVSEENGEADSCESDLTESQEDATEEKKMKKISKKAIIIISAVAAVLAAAYLGVALYFSNYFLMGTAVNGVDCTGMTVKEVKNIMQSQVEEYVLTIEERNDVTEVIKGVDIGIKYKGADVIEDAFEKQNPYAWIVSVFKGKDIKADIDFEYDSEKLGAVISQLACMQAENQVAPVSATPVYVNGTYEIQEEVHGTQVHTEELHALICKSVDGMESKINLEENNCYVSPTYTKDSAEVVAAKDELNKCLEANITYSLDGVTVAVNKDMIQPWLSVDGNMAVVINAEQVRAFTNSLGTTYNTPNTVGEIVTPNGKVAQVPNGRLGRVVGAAAECEQLMTEVREGKTVTREPILSQQATPEGATRWGATYIEVDITQQHMWYVVDGTAVFESDIITGLAGKMDTPVGIFNVLEKLSPKVLRGNIVPETGQPEYITPVQYWLRVTWSGVGFHDCTWHAVFGGEIYKTSGSHGCINMPPAAAATLYGLAPVGCPIVIHH